MDKRYWISSVSLTHSRFELATDHCVTAFLCAGLGLYVFDNKAGQQIVSNDPRVEHFLPHDPFLGHNGSL